jgi:hypothetical protein
MAVAITEESSVSLSSLQPLWHEDSPDSLVENCPSADPVSGWKTWQKHLRSRKKPIAPPFTKKKQPALLWGWPQRWEREVVRAAILSPTTLAEVAIGEDAIAAPDLPLSLQLIALAYALPKLAKDLPAETWWFLVERLHATATQASLQRIDRSAEPPIVVQNQLLAGELPLALSYLFPEVRALRALGNDASAALSEALVEVTDGQGLPHARLLPVLGPLFACWTRCRWLGQHLRGGPWSREAELQYQWLVRHAIRLADVDGRFLLSSQSTDMAGYVDFAANDWNRQLFEMAIRLAGDRGDCAAANEALPRGIVPKKWKRKSASPPAPSLNSDWASVTIMADGWAQTDARLAIAYANDPPAFELSVDGERVFAGVWTCDTLADGKPVEAAAEWEQLCFETGKRFDFLELGLTLTNSLRLERQILFGREDRVVYLADIIFATDGARRRLQHSFSLPLAYGALWKPEGETRDGVIFGSKLRAAVLPLALNEWRADPRGGSLVEQDGQLVLTQETSGRALCCPLFIDLERKRTKKERTWRKLSVAEWMEIVSPEVAVGYRAQSGDDQWLIYRSLAPPGNRTLLGHNVAGEFCAGRFAGAKFKEWIEIEPV